MQSEVSTARNKREMLVSDKQRKYTQVHAAKGEYGTQLKRDACE